MSFCLALFFQGGQVLSQIQFVLIVLEVVSALLVCLSRQRFRNLGPVTPVLLKKVNELSLLLCIPHLMLEDLPSALRVVRLLLVALITKEDALVPPSHIPSILFLFQLFFDVEMNRRGKLM